MGNRDSSIDIAKGICIFLMVLGHTCFYSWFNDRVYLFHMPFFFFVSGFFFSSKKEVKDFIITKTKRLLIPMFFYWAFCVLLTLPMSLRSGSLPDLHIGALWFLLSLWTIFILAYLISKFVNGNVSKLLVGVVLMALAYHLDAHGVKVPFHFVQSLFMLPVFMLGNIFYQTKVSLCSTNQNVSLYQLLFSNRKFYFLLGAIGLVVLIFCKLSYLNVEQLIVPNPLSLFVGAFSGIFFILTLSRILNQLLPAFADALCKLGKNSLHILGIHFAVLQLLYFFCIALIIRFEQKLGGNINTGEEIKMNMPLLSLLIAITVTWISYQIGLLFEKRWPFLWGLKK